MGGKILNRENLIMIVILISQKIMNSDQRWIQRSILGGEIQKFFKLSTILLLYFAQTLENLVKNAIFSFFFLTM